MTRRALPQNYLLDAGTLFEDFGTFTDWTGEGTAGGSIEVDTVHYVAGSTKSLKINVPANGFYKASKTISANLSEASKIMRLSVYITDPTNISYIRILFASSLVGGWVKYFSYELSSAYLNLTPGWNVLSFSRVDFTNTGGESWDNTMIAMMIRVGATSGGATNISVGSLYCNTKARTKVLLTFDDGNYSTYEHGVTYMNSKGLKGTLYVITGAIGGTNRMTAAQCDAAYAAGWAISNHTYAHINLTTLTEPEIEDAITMGRDWLLNRGYTRSANHLSIPFGAYNDTVLTAFDNVGLETARSSVIGFETPPVTDPHLLKTYSIGNTTTLAAAKGYVDKAIRRETSLILILHALVETPTVDTEWGIADFQAFVDYLIERNVDIVTIDEFYEGLTNPRYRSLPLSRATA